MNPKSNGKKSKDSENYQVERHSLLKQDPSSNLALLRPKNEDSEKQKFELNWQKGRVYNPRFQYNDSQAAQRVVEQMKVVFSLKYK